MGDMPAQPPRPDFNNCLWGWYPYYNHPNANPFDHNAHVGYAKAVLRCKTGHTSLAKDWWFDGAMFLAVKDLQAFAGLPQDGLIRWQEWDWLDLIALS